MVNSQLLEEVEFVSLKNKLLDKKLIKKIIESVIEQTDEITKKKFNGVYFGDTKWKNNAVCTCDISIGDIKIDYDKLVYQYKNSKTLSVLESNLDMISDFLHEIEHLKEDSKIELLNFESILISYSCFEIFEFLAKDKLKLFRNFIIDSFYNELLRKKEEKLYLKIYDKIPSERLATIFSYKILLESINKYEDFKTRHPKAFQYINNTYVNKYYLGYEKIVKGKKIYNSPLLDYLNFIEMPDILCDFNFFSTDIKKLLKNTSKQFSIEEKMLYGFPVTLEDTKKLDKKLILTK